MTDDTTSNISMYNISIVPVTLRALRLCGAFGGSFADCRKKTDARTSQLGVELRWVLPPELRRGTVVKKKVRFPAIPDQWLVTRFLTTPRVRTEQKLLALDGDDGSLVQRYETMDCTISYHDLTGTGDHTYFVMGWFSDLGQDPLFTQQRGLGTWWLPRMAPEPGACRSAFFGWIQASGEAEGAVPVFRPCLAPSAATALGMLASQDEEAGTKSFAVAAFSLGLLASPESAAQHGLRPDSWDRDGRLPSLPQGGFVPREAGQTWEIRPKPQQREKKIKPATRDLWTAFEGLQVAQRTLNELKIRALGLEWEAEVLRLRRTSCRILSDQEAQHLDRRVTELEKRSDDQQARVEGQSARVDQQLEAIRSQLVGTELELVARAEPPFGEPGAPCLAIKSHESPQQEAWEGGYALSLRDLLTREERGELPELPQGSWIPLGFPNFDEFPRLLKPMRPLFPAYQLLFRAVGLTIKGFPNDLGAMAIEITRQLPATLPYDSFQAVSARWTGAWAQCSVTGESPLHRSLLPTFRHQVAQVVEQALSGDVADSERAKRTEAIVGGLFGFRGRSFPHAVQVMAASLTELRAVVHAMQAGKLRSAGDRFSLEDITLVDHFGRGLTVGGDDTAARQSECAIDLGARFVVPARHELVPLRADSDEQIASDGDPASSPVAAWLVHSRADHAMLVYDCTGRLVGYFQFETPSRRPRWCPVSIQEQVRAGDADPVLDATAPRTGLVWSGGAETVALPQGEPADATPPQVASIPNEAFSRLWRAIHRASADPEGGLRAAIEAHTDDITSRTVGGSAFAQLFGPPIALVRAKLRLEVVGETNGETEPATLIRLGSPTDGLIAVLASDGMSGSSTFEESPVAFDAPLSKGGTECVLLMDPSKGVEVSSELLPRSRFRLWATYTTALDRLEYVLPTFPALIARKPIAQDATLERQLLPGVPVPRHVNGRWSWGYKASEGWRDHPEACADAIEPVIPVNPIEAFDGFLSVTPAGSK